MSKQEGQEVEEREDKKGKNRATGRKTSAETGTLSDIGLGIEVLFFENSKWLKTKEAAEYLRTSPNQIRKWVYQGRVKSYKLLGKSLRFKRTELDLLLEGGSRVWE